MELRRPRGFATFITYPLKDGSGNLVSGVNTLRPQYATFTDSNPVSTISNIAGFCSELGATGIYYTSLSASEMANDYVYVIASPGSGSAKRLDILINCTKIASVQAVSDVVTATISSGTGTGQLSLTNGRVGINWTDIINATSSQALTLTTIASVNNVATCNFVASVSSAVLSNVGTVTGVTNSVSVATITGVTNSVGVREGTGGNQLSLSTGRIGLNWNDIINPTSTQNLTGTTIASASNVATCQFVASVGAAVLSNVSTVTGVSNSVGVRSGTGGNQLNLSNGRVGINWTDIANATSSQALSATSLATVDGVTSSVSPDWSRVNNPTSTVNLTNTTVASASNVATCQFVASVSNAVLTNVATVTGVTNTVVATVSQVSASLIADRFLARNLARGSDGTRTVQDALRLLRNRRALTTGAMGTATLTSYQEDDATPAWTAVVSTASATGLTDIDST